MVFKFIALLNETERALEREVKETKLSALYDLSCEIRRIRDEFLDYSDNLLTHLSDLASQVEQELDQDPQNQN